MTNEYIQTIERRLIRSISVCEKCEKIAFLAGCIAMMISICVFSVLAGIHSDNKVLMGISGALMIYGPFIGLGVGEVFHNRWNKLSDRYNDMDI